jgi:hypothetical protein
VAKPQKSRYETAKTVFVNGIPVTAPTSLHESQQSDQEFALVYRSGDSGIRIARGFYRYPLFDPTPRERSADLLPCKTPRSL